MLTVNCYVCPSSSALQVSRLSVRDLEHCKDSLGESSYNSLKRHLLPRRDLGHGVCFTQSVGGAKRCSGFGRNYLLGLGGCY
jgi:hypothetical protein